MASYETGYAGRIAITMPSAVLDVEPGSYLEENPYSCFSLQDLPQPETAIAMRAEPCRLKLLVRHQSALKSMLTGLNSPMSSVASRTLLQHHSSS